MWKRIAPLLIILSVALNIAFVGVWGVHVVRGHWGGSGRCGREEARERVGCPMYRRLDVTDEQRQRLEPRLTEFRRKAQAICQEVTRLRGELIDLIAAAEPDRKAIAAKQEQIGASQQRMQQLVVERLLAEKRVLTAQQQQQWFDMLQRRSACDGHGPMMGPGRTGAGHTCPGSAKQEPATKPSEN